MLIRKSSLLIATLLACSPIGLTLARAQQGTVYLAVGSDKTAGQPGNFPVDFGGSDKYQYGDGGEFTAFVTNLGTTDLENASANGGFDLPAGYSQDALRVNPGTSYGYSSADNSATYKGYTGFETFCLEDGIDFYVGAQYTYTLGFTLQDPSSSVGSLSAGVAWLYQQFATGVLSGYDYGNDQQHLVDAGEIQSAIWYLEGEVNQSNANISIDPYAPSPTINNAYYNDVINHFGGGAAGLSAALAAVDNLNASYGVEVLELKNGGAIAQDQLVYVQGVHVVDRSSSLMLLALGLMSLGVCSRRTSEA